MTRRLAFRQGSLLLVLFPFLQQGLASNAQAQAIDLCQGLVQDKQARSMTALAKPALGATVVDPQFGTLIRRISAVARSGADPVIKPVYSSSSVWNADESRMILYQVGSGHKLYDGRDYSFIRALDIAPNEIEGVFWHTSDPDLFLYASGNQLIRYHVSTGVKDVVHTFAFCSGTTSADPHGFTSWDSNVLGLRCSSTGQSFFYRVDTDTVSGLSSGGSSAPTASASGTLGYRNGSVVDISMRALRALDLSNPAEHSSLGRLSGGHDTYNAPQFDSGPRGSGVGSLVTHDMVTGSARVIVGPTTGFPYPPSDTHVSALAYKQPGWVFESIVGDPAGRALLDNELLLADTNTGKVCRIGRHRSWGKNNTVLGNAYWAEPHVVASPSGTRAVFGSDWGNGPTVDTYVVELPRYAWFDVAAWSGDHDGDGKSDLLWLRRASGQLALWAMNGGALRSSTAGPVVPGGWQIAGTGDYDGDGKADVLLRSPTGQLRVWLMNGAALRSSVDVATAAGPQREIVGSGDYDGDGRSDIALYEGGTGAVSVWLMNGGAVRAQAVVGTLTDATARVIGSGDYNGDGRSDLLVRTGSSGSVQIWFMNGTGVTSRGTVMTLADANWQVVGTGDYNGDGRADLLLRHRVTGVVYLLLMDGARVTGQGAVLALSDLNLRMAGSGDYNGDGKAELLLRHRTTGAVYVVFMSGIAATSASALPAVADQGWETVRTP